MSEKRVVSRREPIVVSVEGVADFNAYPLPWRKRNDLGNLITEQYISALNEAVDERKPADGARVGKISLVESGMDYVQMLSLAFPDNKVDEFEQLDFEALVVVLSASLEVNGLDRLVYLIDPAKKGPEPEAPDVEADDGAKIESLPDSSSPELDQTNETS